MKLDWKHCLSAGGMEMSALRLGPRDTQYVYRDTAQHIPLYEASATELSSKPDDCQADDPMPLVASYGIEMLNCRPGAKYTIGFLVTGVYQCSFVAALVN